LQVGVELTKCEVKFKRLINSQLPISLCASGERPQLQMSQRKSAKPQSWEAFTISGRYVNAQLANFM
jgi:hypothetical protein